MSQKKKRILGRVLSLSFLLLLISQGYYTQAEEGVYKYTDGSGVSHYVDDPSKIPEKFRAKSDQPHELPEIQHQDTKPARRVWAPQRKFQNYQAPSQMPDLTALREAVEAQNNVETEKTEPKQKAMEAFLSSSWKKILIVLGVIVLLHFISLWILLNRADLPGWGAIVPVYNLVLISRLGGYSGWWILWLCVPFIGTLVWSFSVNYGIAKNFDRGDLFAIGTALFPFIFLPIIAFTD